MNTTTQAIRAEINNAFDPKGRTRKLANRLALFLLRERDPDAAYSALVAAAALFLSDPDAEFTKENAIEQARELGGHIADEVEEGFEIFVANRRKQNL